MIRTVSLVVLGVVMVSFAVTDKSALRYTARAVWDRFDDRPARNILFLGNSRMYYNNMPYLARELAESAGIEQKYQITMRALPGASLEGLWKDTQVQRLLDQGNWNDVVIQGETRAHVSATNLASFQDYGARLIYKAQQEGAKVALIVNWNYGPELFSQPTAEVMEEHDRTIQRDYRALADQTGAGLINSGISWRIVSAAEPSIPLYTDGNHPSVQGSYLSALTTFSCLTDTSVFQATYTPWRLSKDHAARIRNAMANSPANGLLCSKPRSARSD